MHISGWGGQQGSQDYLCCFCLMQISCCTLLWASEAPYLSQLTSQLGRGFPGWKNLSSFAVLSLQGQRYCSNFCFFSFVLPGYLVILLAGLWDLPVVSSYFVRIIPHIAVFLRGAELHFLLFYHLTSTPDYMYLKTLFFIFLMCLLAIYMYVFFAKISICMLCPFLTQHFFFAVELCGSFIYSTY